MPEMIGFFGSYPADICMYTAYALQNAGKRVCVIDNSDDGILFSCVPAPDCQMQTVTFHNVDFIRHKPLVQWHELDYELVLIQLGSRPQELCLAVCSMRILVVDCERRNMEFYQHFLQACGLSAVVLLRGFSLEFAVEKAKRLLECGPGLIERWLLLPLDEEDETYRIQMQYGTMYQFAHISAGMERVLGKMLRMLDVTDRVHIAQAVRNAKQGKTADPVCCRRRIENKRFLVS